MRSQVSQLVRAMLAVYKPVGVILDNAKELIATVLGDEGFELSYDYDEEIYVLVRGGISRTYSYNELVEEVIQICETL